MLAFSIFILSGAGIIILTLAKRLEEKRRGAPTLILRAVSRGDERVRNLHHKALHHYSVSKDKFGFWFKKQLPLKLKIAWNKLEAELKERGASYLGDMRNSRLLKKPDGMSEFFKTISEIEKGTGEINESLPLVSDDFLREPLIDAKQADTVVVLNRHNKKLHTPRRKKIKVVEII